MWKNFNMEEKPTGLSLVKTSTIIINGYTTSSHGDYKDQ